MKLKLKKNLTTTCWTSLQVSCGAASSMRATMPAARGAAADVPTFDQSECFGGRKQIRQPSFLHIFFHGSLLHPPSNNKSKSWRTCVTDRASSTNISCGNLLVCVGTRTESINCSYRSNCCDNPIYNYCIRVQV